MGSNWIPTVSTTQTHRAGTHTCFLQAYQILAGPCRGSAFALLEPSSSVPRRRKASNERPGRSTRRFDDLEFGSRQLIKIYQANFTELSRFRSSGSTLPSPRGRPTLGAVTRRTRRSCWFGERAFVTSGDALVTSSFLLRVVRPGASSSDALAPFVAMHLLRS